MLDDICVRINQAVLNARAELRMLRYGGNYVTELLVWEESKVRVEIRCESPRHNRPHMHVSHSDGVDAVIGIPELDLIAGKIDGRTMRHLMHQLRPFAEELLDVWSSLNERGDSAEAHRIIENIRG